MEVGQRRVGKTENQVQGRTAAPCPENRPLVPSPTRAFLFQRADHGDGLTDFSAPASFIFSASRSVRSSHVFLRNLPRALHPCGCTYTSVHRVEKEGPSGSWHGSLSFSLSPSSKRSWPRPRERKYMLSLRGRGRNVVTFFG